MRIAPPTLRQLLAGALAGLLGALAMMIAITLPLLTLVMLQYAFNSSIPVIRDTAWGAVLQDVGRLPTFLLGWYPVALGLVAYGALSAGLERLAQALPDPWRARATPATMVAIATSVAAAALLVGADQGLLRAVDVSEGLPTFAQRRPTVGGQIGFFVPIAFMLSGMVWFFWSWWHARAQRWLGVAPVPSDRPGAEIPADQWFALRQARERAQRAALLMLGGSLVLLIGLAAAYDQQRPIVQSGELWLEPATPEGLVRLRMDRPQRVVMLENTYGFGPGSVEAALVAGPGQPPLLPAVTVAFRDSRVRYDRTPIDAGGLPAGEYMLRAQLREGAGGRVGYALIQGAGLAATLLAALTGLCGGVALALATLIVGLRAPRQDG